MDVSREKAVDLLFSWERVNSEWLHAFRAGIAADQNWILICEGVVRECYQRDQSKRDGYGRIAWALRESERMAEAIEYFARDYEANRMGRWQFLRFVESLLRAGIRERAEAVVSNYYDLNPEAKDGWAAFALHEMSLGELGPALAFFRRDFELGRLSTGVWRDLIELEWQHNEYRAVEHLIDRLYQEDSRAKNVFSSYGVKAFRRGDQELADRLFRLERNSTRAVPIDLFGNVWSVLGAVSSEESIREWISFFQKHLGKSAGDGSDSVRLKLAEVLFHYGWMDIAIAVLEPSEVGKHDYSATFLERLAKRPLRVDHKVFIQNERCLTKMLNGSFIDRRLVAGYVRSSMKRVFRDFYFLKDRVDPKETLVDFGCTPPLLLSLLSDAGYNNLSAIDPSAGQYASFFYRSKIDFYCDGAAELGVERLVGEVDVLCMCEVIEHLSIDIAPLMLAANAMLRKGGRLYLTTPNLRSISGLYALVCKSSGLASKANEKVRDQLDRVDSSSKYYGHIREYTSKELVELVESFGFRLVERRMSSFSLLNRNYPALLLLIENMFPNWRLFGAYLFEKTGER